MESVPQILTMLHLPEHLLLAKAKQTVLIRSIPVAAAAQWEHICMQMVQASFTSHNFLLMHFAVSQAGNILPALPLPSLFQDFPQRREEQIRLQENFSQQ